MESLMLIIGQMKKKNVCFLCLLFKLDLEELRLRFLKYMKT